ncbi:2Fe-2S iron-sulfur cluster binding domain-containing protein [Pseudomonas sp. SZ57]|uniref:2Fe-2S iron-sulfur cluster-binding protein n=1 Tax=Pseudomonas TaxID=286 RepID=UPI0009BEE729|nr:2Fe-2S iron-sulfur cluster binding domain-containing protein [Pseudomonas sp. SZ57]
MSKTLAPALGYLTLQVRFNGVCHSGVCDPQRTLLENIEAMGLQIRSACRRGRCGSCKVRLEVGGLHPERHILEDGYVLSCCSLLTSDASVVVDYTCKDSQ